MTDRFRFFHSCVGFPGDVDELSRMIDEADEIDRDEFLKHVSLADQEELERDLGYTLTGLQMVDDWHVRYSRGQLYGRPAYFFTHSATEYIFTPDGAMQAARA